MFSSKCCLFILWSIEFLVRERSLSFIPKDAKTGMIIQNKKIRGINFNNTEIKISQYADDTTLILDGQDVSLHAALKTLEIYGTVSGLKVHTDKTQIVWIGKKEHAKEKIDTVKNLVWGNTDFNL